MSLRHTYAFCVLRVAIAPNYPEHRLTALRAAIAHQVRACALSARPVLSVKKELQSRFLAKMGSIALMVNRYALNVQLDSSVRSAH